MAEIKNKQGVTHCHIHSVIKVVQEQATVIKYLAQKQELCKISDDLKKRCHRMNLLFYGIDDKDLHEILQQSGTLAKGICTVELEYHMTTIQRAHQVCVFNKTEKKRNYCDLFIRERKEEAILKQIGRSHIQ